MAGFFSQFISKKDLVFDIGANLGSYTKVFSDLGARIVAVDPQPTCVEILHRKFAACPDVTVVAAGLGSKEEIRPFYICRQNHTTSTFSENFMRKSRYALRTWEEVIQTPVVTLDSLVNRYGLPAFIKIDTEGYELEVLRGLTAPVPQLSFEFSKEFPEITSAALQHLEALGKAEFNYSTPGSFTLALPTWVDAKSLKRVLSQKWSLYAGGDIYCRMQSGGMKWNQNSG